MRRPRICRSSSAFALRRSVPSNWTAPRVMRALAGRSRTSDPARVLFPDPDSPRTPMISPGMRPKLTLVRAGQSPPPLERYETWRSWISRMAIMCWNVFAHPPVHVEAGSSSEQVKHDRSPAKCNSLLHDEHSQLGVFLNSAKRIRCDCIQG